MRIAEVRVFVLKLEHDEPYLGAIPPGEGYAVREPWRSLYSPRFEALLIAVRTEDGTVGWGEALAPVGPEVAGTVIATLLRPMLVGAEFSGPRPMWETLRNLMRERGHLVGHQADALAAVDIALWDLAGRRAGLSVSDLLGGSIRSTVPTYVSGLPRMELAREWADRGARLIKLHLGHSVASDLSTVDSLLGAHPALSVAVDAHWAYSLPDALRLGVELERRGRVRFLEAPLAPEDVEGHRELARRIALPVAVGETLRNRYEFDHWLSRRAIGLAQPDVARTGITEAAVIGALASARHVQVAPHHSTGLGIAVAAGLHLSAALDNLAFFEYQPTSVEVADRILQSPLVVDADSMGLPKGPGLGVEVDLDAVTTHADEL